MKKYFTHPVAIWIYVVLGAILVLWLLWQAVKLADSRGVNSERASFAACDKFASDCAGKGGDPGAWAANRCDVLWNACLGTWDRKQGSMGRV